MSMPQPACVSLCSKGICTVDLVDLRDDSILSEVLLEFGVHGVR